MDKFKLNERFEFFFIGLIFTLLAATIQTADFENVPTFAFVVEVLGIIGLLISGFAGVNKLEWLPSLIHAYDVGIERNKPVDLLEKWDKKKDELLDEHVIKNDIQRWGFYIGLTLILVGRVSNHVVTSLNSV